MRVFLLVLALAGVASALLPPAEAARACAGVVDPAGYTNYCSPAIGPASPVPLCPSGHVGSPPLVVGYVVCES